MTALVTDYLWIPATTLCLLILLAVTAIINRVDRNGRDAGGEL
jgi:hypothetical protein